MCGFILTNKFYHESLNYFCQKRGPNHTSHLVHEGIHFIHNLLDISSYKHCQPLIKNETFCLYNGEIYNPSNSYDGHSIPFNGDFSQIDGEFAVVLVNFPNDTLIITTDIFGTKPLWYAIEKPYFGISSYESPLLGLGFVNPIKLKANTTLEFTLSSLEFKTQKRVHTFSLNQTKASYDDWCNAFERSIIKRSKSSPKIFLGLSSGYDSGAIACALKKTKTPFHPYTILGKENKQIILQRKEKHNLTIITPNLPQIKTFLKKECESYRYKITLPSKETVTQHLFDDEGALGLASLCTVAQKHKEMIYLSGQGADEIMTDYSMKGSAIFGFSSFNGIFPEKLSSIFPWPNFFGSSQESYLTKEEYICGTYGIEARYPFLDKDLVQEFLSLSSKLKNTTYKAPIAHYLSTHHYPFKKMKKIGFSCKS
jgi:asparagine synthetase B (glutamine-hydrolysing)